MPVGRPTKYEGEVTLAKVSQFLKGCVDEIGADGKTIVRFPSNESLANFLEVSRETLYEWARVYPEFSDMLEKVQVQQAEKLLNSGLGGQYTSAISKLVLAKHGYHDVSESNLKNDGGKFEPSALTPAMMAIVKKAEEEMKDELLK